MRRLRIWLFTTVTAAGAVLVPVGSAPPAGSAPDRADGFAGHATGTALYATALPAAGGLVARAGFSAASVDSGGLASTRTDELRSLIVAGGSSRSRTDARGRGLDVSLGRRLLLSGVAESAAPPVGGPASDEERLPGISGLVSASLAGAEADPAWSEGSCVAGRPLARGLGRAVDLNVADLLTTAGPAGSAVARSVSRTYLSPNDDASFGLVSEARQQLAAVTILAGTPLATTIEVLGETVLRATSTGKPGGDFVTYAPAGSPNPTAPFVRISHGGRTIAVSTQDVFGGQGLKLALAPLVSVAVGEAPRRASSGRLAAAVDLVRVSVLGGAGSAPVEVRLGHLEASAQAAPGGLRCAVPVTKRVDLDPVAAKQPFTFTISIPSSASALDGLGCDLANLAATDVVTADPGVRFRLESASSGGVIDGGQVRWPNLGRYHPGDPPLTLTVTGVVVDGSGAGAIEDTVHVTGDLANCVGDPPGQPGATRQRSALRGSATLVGPRLTP